MRTTRLAFTPRLAAATRTVFRALTLALLAGALAIFGCFGVNGEVAFGAWNVLAGQSFDRGDRLGVERGDHRDRGAGPPGAAGTADAMHVVVGMMRHIEIEDVAHDRDIEAAGRDVGSNQQRNLALAELIQRRGTRRLIHIAVQRADTEAVLEQRLVDNGDFALAVAEDDRVLKVLGVAQQAAQDIALFMRLAADADLELGHAHGGGGGLGNLDPRRIVQEGFGDAADFRRHRRGEEQRLPGEGNQLADAFDVGNEAHVQHAVGFVDDQQFNAGEQQSAALGMVEQPARRCDQHVDAARQFGILIAERNAADQKRDVELLADAVFIELFLDLGCQLAGRLHNEGARHACPGAALFQHGQHRQHEGRRLAGAGLGDAEDVAAGQNEGDRLILNGGGGGVTGGCNRSEHLVGQTEMGKRH